MTIVSVCIWQVRTQLGRFQSAARLDQICRALGTPPAVAVRANTLKTTPAEHLEQLKKHIASIDHPAAAACAQSVVLHPVLPDVALIPPIRCDTPSSPEDETCPAVWVDCICAEAVMRGAAIFAPGVLAASPHCTAEAEQVTDNWQRCEIAIGCGI